MQIHTQRSTREKTWFDAEVVDNGDGTLTIPASSFWVAGVEYPLDAYSPSVGTSAFRISVEQVGNDADYLLDLTGAADPVGFGPGIDAALIVWRDADGGDVHVLRSVDHAA
tara:strand:- start:2843 stop:3175 length:333 start_codon:yes stop_codon:yes gene_type:complete